MWGGPQEKEMAAIRRKKGIGAEKEINWENLPRGKLKPNYSYSGEKIEKNQGKKDMTWERPRGDWLKEKVDLKECKADNSEDEIRGGSCQGGPHRGKKDLRKVWEGQSAGEKKKNY